MWVAPWLTRRIFMFKRAAHNQKARKAWVSFFSFTWKRKSHYFSARGLYQVYLILLPLTEKGLKSCLLLSHCSNAANCEARSFRPRWKTGRCCKMRQPTSHLTFCVFLARRTGHEGAAVVTQVCSLTRWISRAIKHLSNQKSTARFLVGKKKWPHRQESLFALYRICELFVKYLCFVTGSYRVL